jgi:hypothetical protein
MFTMPKLIMPFQIGLIFFSSSMLCRQYTPLGTHFIAAEKTPAIVWQRLCHLNRPPANCAKDYFQPGDVLEFGEVFSLGCTKTFQPGISHSHRGFSPVLVVPLDFI